MEKGSGMGKRPGSRQREMRLGPQAEGRSRLDAAGRAAFERQKVPGLLGSLLGRLAAPAPGVLVDHAAAEKALQARYKAFESAPDDLGTSKVAKVAAKAWSEVTKGEGVTLVNRKEVPVKGGD
jgi:hypothetical protein